jgi:hypothetical protein
MCVPFPDSPGEGGAGLATGRTAASNSVVWCVALATLASACRGGRVVRVEQTGAECCSCSRREASGPRDRGRLVWAPPATVRAIPESGCGGAFLLESMNANVEMIPAMITEDARAGLDEAMSKRSDRRDVLTGEK